MEQLPQLTVEMTLVLAIVTFAVFLFATELLRVDVAAVLVMTMLGLLVSMPGLEGLVRPNVLFSGFASNAVISIIAVRILGRGLDKTGVMERIAWAILSAPAVRGSSPISGRANTGRAILHWTELRAESRRTHGTTTRTKDRFSRSEKRVTIFSQPTFTRRFAGRLPGVSASGRTIRSSRSYATVYV